MPFCEQCGAEGAGDFCKACGKARGAPIIVMETEDPRASRIRDLNRRSATTRYSFPAALSFIVPGLGQIVKGQLLTGLIVMIAAAFFGLLCFVGIGVILLPIFWLVQLYDAYVKPDAELAREIKALSGTSPPAP